MFFSLFSRLTSIQKSWMDFKSSSCCRNYDQNSFECVWKKEDRKKLKNIFPATNVKEDLISLCLLFHNSFSSSCTYFKPYMTVCMHVVFIRHTFSKTERKKVISDECIITWWWWNGWSEEMCVYETWGMLQLLNTSSFA